MVIQLVEQIESFEHKIEAQLLAYRDGPPEASVNRPEGGSKAGVAPNVGGTVCGVVAVIVQIGAAYQKIEGPPGVLLINRRKNPVTQEGMARGGGPEDGVDDDFVTLVE